MGLRFLSRNVTTENHWKQWLTNGGCEQRLTSLTPGEPRFLPRSFFVDFVLTRDQSTPRC